MQRQGVMSRYWLLCLVGVTVAATPPTRVRAEGGRGEHYPETRTGYLSEDEVAAWSASQRRYAINEMYARHGFVFSDLSIRKQFLQFGWYKPVPGRSQRQAEALFNHYERSNLQLLTGSRPVHHRTAAAGSQSYPGEHYPETRLRRLTRSQVDAWTHDQLRYAINEMYARHGLLFGDMDIRRQFLQFKWYKPVPGRTQGEAEQHFNHYERENLKVLSASRNYR